VVAFVVVVPMSCVPSDCIKVFPVSVLAKLVDGARLKLATSEVIRINRITRLIFRVYFFDTVLTILLELFKDAANITQ
jgi:hypothetical protein